MRYREYIIVFALIASMVINLILAYSLYDTVSRNIDRIQRRNIHVAEVYA